MFGATDSIYAFFSVGKTIACFVMSCFMEAFSLFYVVEHDTFENANLADAFYWHYSECSFYLISWIYSDRGLMILTKYFIDKKEAGD